jgi:pSer/pThr/pTyr-binding forkhead associated (FHA) protein
VSAYFDWWDGRERRALLVEGDRLIVGSAADNDVVVVDTSVSRIHAVLHQLNGRWFIEDCGSRNGTAVNGQPLTSMCPLRPHDEVRLGRARLVFCGQPSAGGNPTDTVAERPPITAREHDVLVALCRPLANGDVFTESSSGRSRLANAALDADAVTLAELRDR